MTPAVNGKNVMFVAAAWNGMRNAARTGKIFKLNIDMAINMVKYYLAKMNFINRTGRENHGYIGS